jgi:S1-C subfamily serine protease
MGLRPSDVLGLAIGFMLGGLGLLWFAPWLTAPHPEAEEQRPAPKIALVSPTVQRPSAVAPVQTSPAPAMAAKPPIVHQTPASSLPAIVYPTRPQEGMGFSGTGFFIAADGLILTADHVAGDCKQRRIVSPHVALTSVELVATDPKHDIALLRAPRLRVPAILPVARPSRGDAGVRLFGYPASGDMLVPTEAAGALRRPSVPASTDPAIGPKELVWFEAKAVGKGFSGGPVIDQERRRVVGMVKGTYDASVSRRIFGPASEGIAMGPASDRLTAFVQREVPWLDVENNAPSDQPLTTAAKAVVHVLCYR